MKTLEKSKTILNIAIAISIVLCSLSLFIYSLNYSPANAKPVNTTIDNNYKVAGVLTYINGDICVIGYNENNGSIKVLAKSSNWN